MKLSALTLSILKNFGSINSYLLIEPGNILQTTSLGGVQARAVVAEDFKTRIIIYDLVNFLSVVGLFQQPEFTFESDLIRITGQDGEAEACYFYAPPSILHKPWRIPAPPTHVIEFEVPEQKWSTIQNAASVLSKCEVRVVSDGDRVELNTYDHKNPNTHRFSTPVIAETNGHRCEHILSMANLRLLKGPYHWTVSPRYTTLVHAGEVSLTYWVACDPASSFYQDLTRSKDATARLGLRNLTEQQFMGA